MNIQDLINALDLKVLTDQKDFSSIEPTYGYSSDLLSCVMAGAPRHGIWVTLQAHGNIVAVAALLELAAVIITEGAMPDENTIQKANDEGVILLSSTRSSFDIIGHLWEMGLRNP
ncbi:MAG: serine kinase [Leptolinea sp.]|jgi:imidazolonepropionase-like amidohydrolase|nr:serine kinase [Leptolinea sp.]